VTVTNLSTGAYLASFTVPSGYAVGDDLQVLVSATVDSVASKAFVGKGVVDSTVASRAVAGDSMALTSGAVDAVWDEAISGHLTSGTTGANLNNASVGSSSFYAVLGLYVKIGETDDTFISAGEGDSVTVALYFRDASHNPVSIPTVDSAAMLDSGNNEVGTVTLTDSHLAVGYLAYTLEIPSSGNMPTRLRVQFDTGSGATHRRDVNIKVTA
jgi:hypothetical protein